MRSGVSDRDEIFNWAVEMMDLYLCGLKKEATGILSEKYGVSERSVQLWKEMFKEYVIKFFEKN